MYDLAGRWDLAVRFRASHEQTPGQHANVLTRALAAEGERGKTEFKDFDFVNVQIEDVSVPADTPDEQETREVEIRRRMLNSSDKYAEYRCQRCFLCIDLPEKDDAVKKKLLNRLRTDIQELEVAWGKGQSIIE